MTPSLARMIAAKGNSLKRPIRWYSIARLFRYEKMQKGRLREFFQLNMDILGSAEITADAELIAAVVDMMRDLGLTEKDFQVRISSRTLLEECFTALGLPIDRFAPLYALLDRKNKVTDGEYQADLATIVPEPALREKINALFSAQSLSAVGDQGGEFPAKRALEQLFVQLDRYGMSANVRFDFNIVRGLAYYTGTVFEVFAIDKGMRAIAGGGRYDKLVELYGGPPTPAVGFAAGDVVLGDLLREKGISPPAAARSRVFIAAIDDTGFADTVQVAQALRGAAIPCEFPFRCTAIGKQLKHADNIGADLTVILGGEEARQGMARIKRMRDGKEISCGRDALIDRVVSLLNGEDPGI
jgi:histidyl-tRNA synthetase